MSTHGGRKTWWSFCIWPLGLCRRTPSRIRCNALADPSYRGTNRIPVDHIVFFGENVDIHHIFPQTGKKRGIKPSVYDSIINKTPLAYRTNRIIGGVAPSEYLAALERGDSKTPAIAPASLNEFLASHQIDPSLLRSDDFEGFMADRQKRLLRLIEQAMGKQPTPARSRKKATMPKKMRTRAKPS